MAAAATDRARPIPLRLARKFFARPACSSGISRVKELQRRAPGALLSEGIEAMRTYVASQGGRTTKDLMSDPVAVAYLQTCLRPALGDKLSARNDKEMAMLAESLDLL